LADDAPIEANDGQCIDALGLQRRSNVRLGSELTRLLREVETLNLHSLTAKPVEVAREAHQGLIDLWSADAGRATHRFVENLHVHDRSPYSFIADRRF
jgi:hypothetical protein